MTKEIEFWILWNPNGYRAPKFKHYNFESADTEAKRLAREHPDNIFYVLHSVSGHILRSPEPDKIQFYEEPPF